MSEILCNNCGVPEFWHESGVVPAKFGHVCPSFTARPDEPNFTCDGVYHYSPTPLPCGHKEGVICTSDEH